MYIMKASGNKRRNNNNNNKYLEMHSFIHPMIYEFQKDHAETTVQVPSYFIQNFILLNAANNDGSLIF